MKRRTKIPSDVSERSKHLPPNLLAVVEATHRKGEHRCIFRAAKKLQKAGLVHVVKISKSGLAATVEPPR